MLMGQLSEQEYYIAWREKTCGFRGFSTNHESFSTNFVIAILSAKMWLSFLSTAKLQQFFVHYDKYNEFRIFSITLIRRPKNVWYAFLVEQRCGAN